MKVRQRLQTPADFLRFVVETGKLPLPSCNLPVGMV